MVDYQKTIARLSKGHHLQSSHAALPKRGLPTKCQTSHHSPLSVIYDTSFTRLSHAANVIARLAKPICSWRGFARLTAGVKFLKHHSNLRSFSLL